MKELSRNVENFGFAFRSYSLALKGRVKADVELPLIMRKVNKALIELEQQGYHLNDEQRRTIDAIDASARALLETDLTLSTHPNHKELVANQEKVDSIGDAFSSPTKSVPVIMRRTELTIKSYDQMRENARMVETDARERLVNSVLAIIGVNPVSKASTL